MKIKNILQSVACLGLGTMMLTGCASDYLDTPVHGTIDATKIAKTTTEARATILGIASGMASVWAYGSSDPVWPLGVGQPFAQGESGVVTYLGEMAGPDNYINLMYRLSTDWAMFYNQDKSVLNGGNYVWNSPMWIYCYGLIGQANELIAVIDGCEGPEAEREFIKGQALTMRAHAYWHLLQVYAPRWCDSNNGEKLSSVVLRIKTDDPDSKDVATVKAVFEQIYKDLDLALESFGKAGNTQRQTIYEPDMSVCYGVYARVAALKEDWAKCRDMAHNARQKSRLATVEEAMSGYNSYNNNEWMWSPSFDKVDDMIYANWCTTYACNGYRAYNQNLTCRIDINLYNQLPEADRRREWWLTLDKLVGLPPAQINNMAYSPQGCDPNYVKLTAAPLLNACRTWLDEHQAQYGIQGPAAYDGPAATCEICDGAQVKFWCNDGLGNTARAQIPYMRATEMYLYEAEACAMLGETGTAQDLLQQVNRVFNPSYTCSLSGQALIDEVRLYRRIELWGEGHNWFDIKRWNIPLVRKAWEQGNPNSGNMPPALGVVVPLTQNNGWRYGIPTSERAYNTAITQAIPGEEASN